MNRKTNRGFSIYSDFTDLDGGNVYIVHSSSATKKAVRIYLSGGSAGPNDGATHLSVAQAKRIIKALEKFIKS